MKVVKINKKTEGIRFNLTKVGKRGLIVDILHMSEELRAKPESHSVILFEKVTYACDFQVISAVIPGISDHYIYVFGSDKEGDFMSPKRLFDTAKERNDMYKFLVSAEKQINKRFSKRQLTHR